MGEQGVVFDTRLADRLVQMLELWERQRGSLRGYPQAQAPAGEVTVARVTSGTADGDGNYPAVVTVRDPDDGSWSDFDPVKVRGANGETLVSGTRYAVKPAGLTAGGDLLLMVVGGVAAASAGLAHVRVTNATHISHNRTGLFLDVKRYLGKLQTWDAYNGLWADGDDVVLEVQYESPPYPGENTGSDSGGEVKEDSVWPAVDTGSTYTHSGTPYPLYGTFRTQQAGEGQPGLLNANFQQISGRKHLLNGLLVHAEATDSEAVFIGPDSPADWHWKYKLVVDGITRVGPLKVSGGDFLADHLQASWEAGFWGTAPPVHDDNAFIILDSGTAGTTLESGTLPGLASTNGVAFSFEAGGVMSSQGGFYRDVSGNCGLYIDTPVATKLIDGVGTHTGFTGSLADGTTCRYGFVVGTGPTGGDGAGVQTNASRSWMGL